MWNRNEFVSAVKSLDQKVTISCSLLMLHSMSYFITINTSVTEMFVTMAIPFEPWM